MPEPQVTSSVRPAWAVPGGRVLLEGGQFSLLSDGPPPVRVGLHDTHVAAASHQSLRLVIPPAAEGGTMPIHVGASDAAGTASVEVARLLATGLHQVDSPAFDGLGRLYVTQSGGRGTKVPVPMYRVSGLGVREPLAVEIANPTSLALGPDGAMYVSSRFEGAVYRVKDDGSHQQMASDLGVACGLTFDADGCMYVGDRSGTIFRVRDGKATPFATLPPSVAAFHLAMSGEGELFVSGPTLGTYDHIHRINRDGDVRTVPTPFGRPQGLAFSPDGALHVIDALAGASGLYRFASIDAEPELVVSGGSLVGVAFGPAGELVVASNDTVYRFE